MFRDRKWILLCALVFVGGLAIPLVADAQAPAPPKMAEAPKKKPDFPKFEEVSKDYEQVISTADGKASMYTLWVRKKDQQMLAELPKNFEKKKYFIATTIASGERFAGLQGGDRYVYWKRYDKRLALIEPNIATRSTGDDESKASVERLFTDRVILDVPIVTMKPRGGPVIDLDELVLKHADKFFGPSVRGMNRNLASIETAKAFPENVEIAYEVPTAGGTLKTLHYSFSVIPEKTGYTPRKADARVGFFTTSYQDLGKYQDDQTWTRYINRWHLEKADPSLKLSPPKQPIVFYIEHTTPIRYRRFVRDGVLSWNKAFEKVGIVDAIEVRFQDAATGAHMEKDPEDVRYNFVRWLNNDIGTAIGPSRVHPLTGQILDADIVLTDGWIRSFDFDFNRLLPQLAMEGFSPETLDWLSENPDWDPRLLMARPHERNLMLAQREAEGPLPYGGHPLANVDPTLLGDDEFDGLDRHSQVNGLCLAAVGKAFDLATLRMTRDLILARAGEEEGDEKGDTLDGMPADFIGPLLADLVAHECGHTLGLRHNFKASSAYTLDQINSDDFKGKKPFTTSVMDYNPININMDEDRPQGDFAMIDIGPYDMWAIEYGYSFDKDLKPILARCNEAEHAYGTDEDTMGPDPYARRYDFTANPLDYAKSQMELATYHRNTLLEKFVKDGESWAKARLGYNVTLSLQVRALSMIANWVGSAYVYRDKKGDAGNRAPIEVVPAETQREALAYVIENSFFDKSFGITPELLVHLTVDKWYDGGGMRSVMEDATYPIHDRIMSIQGSVMTMLLNPSTLRRLLDNEKRCPPDQDCLTLPEVLSLVRKAAWTELDGSINGGFSDRKPMISSLRRHLQRQHVERLIDLSVMDRNSSAASKTISSLATMELWGLSQKMAAALDGNRGSSLDPYTLAHLTDLKKRVDKTLDARYVVSPR